MASFYADENFRYPVIEELRKLGHDVLTCQEAGRAGQGIDDEIVLGDAQMKSRILLTQNREDFKKLDKKKAAPPGHRRLYVRPGCRGALPPDRRGSVP